MIAAGTSLDRAVEEGKTAMALKRLSAPVKVIR
jgi:hypothetical protein